jgi:hypothetical protein
MTAERDACVKLIELGKAKKDQLIENRVTQLNLTVRAESEAVKKLKTASKYRVEALKGVALEFGLEYPIELNDVLALLPNENREQAQGIKASIQLAVEELAALNALNQKLIETQIQYTEFCLSMLTEGPERLDTYENTGHMRGENPALKSLIDTKA